jgi:hypothetical protein
MSKQVQKQRQPTRREPPPVDPLPKRKTSQASKNAAKWLKDNP